jgi:aminopeptidase-like protein
MKRILIIFFFLLLYSLLACQNIFIFPLGTFSIQPNKTIPYNTCSFTKEGHFFIFQDKEKEKTLKEYHYKVLDSINQNKGIIKIGDFSYNFFIKKNIIILEPIFCGEPTKIILMNTCSNEYIKP